ncbi:tRNA (cytosine(34)-C(5))-methyltransferase [Phymastichus coffea]|uniref:tRNA (cytosine(34)-C(5))-methyltransferase n=1 Tax=Phymastichus coffea TaxID=108790 RepID=UPI00273C153B|nr:tRNA (cytosine(34)-C(5))-methyltransferase [Phymastichus coffea]
MGKGRKYKPKKNFAEKRREKQKMKDKWNTAPQRSYKEIIRENKDFEAYYKTQKIVPDEQWTIFINKMKENLPVAFRITGSKAEAKTLLKIIKGDYFKEILNIPNSNICSDYKDAKPHSLPFYPEELAWQLQLTRKDIRRSEAFFKLHNFLITETNSGNISRQEVVSMVPPLVLDINPSHKILDMCAAPGSKTAQLIEMIHSDEKVPVPDGFVIANDLDNNRCYMLVHQAKRLNSPNILITNHDSSVMPNFTFTEADGSKRILKFDRILADVPCSGDGTMRKNPDIWCKWSPANGNNLHGIQYRIAKRGVELLEIGGKMVYSTCSLNPIENEAVLHRLLAEAEGSIHLVDGQNFVPGLVYNHGLTYWQPASKNLEHFNCWKDVPGHLQTQIRPKMFPPNKDEAEKYHLERCMRILPHHQDTGGFFVAVLEKIKPLPWEMDNYTLSAVNIVLKQPSSQSEEYGTNNEGKKRNLETDMKPCGPQKKRKRLQGYKEDPFVFFKNKNEDIWPSIQEFYDISDNLNPECLLVRCYEGKKKNIYFTSPRIRDLVMCNVDKIKMINTGIKTFVRCDNKNMICAFRLAQEGLNNIVHFIGDCRKIQILKEDLIMLLQNSDHNIPPEISKLNVVTQERLKSFAKGSCILIYEEINTANEYPLKLKLVGWRGSMSLRAYISTYDAIHYLRLLGGDCSMFEKNKFQENRDALALKVIKDKEADENNCSRQE